jgi:pentatricopeptide repeat protein
VILGVANHAENEKAFSLYLRMLEKGQLPDMMTFTSVLKAFGNEATLQNGKRIHSQVHREVFDESEVVLATALIDMYGKCGGMKEAEHVFDAMHSKDLVAWSALITGYTRQGEVESVFCTYERMQDEGVQPDESTFLSVLNSCNHVGLVDKGWKYFESASKANPSSITIKHLNCIVDLLGRAGRLDEAILILKDMPFKPDLSTCCTILNSCRIWGNIKLGRHMFDFAMKSDEKHQTPYLLMYNVYADSHMWKEAKEIQDMYAKVHGKEVSEQKSWINTDGLCLHL